MKWIVGLLLLAGIVPVSCTQKAGSPELIVVDYQHDLIPEGIAVNPATGDIFLSSLHRKKIVKADNQGQHPRDLIDAGDYGYAAGVGMTVKNGKLYAVSSHLQNTDHYSTVLALDPESGKLIRDYPYTDTARHFLNDLAVSDDGQIFVTDSDAHRVFAIHNDGRYETLIESEEIAWPNGIALSDDGNLLYIASNLYGIRTFDLNKKQIVNPRDTTGLTRGIDGMKFYHNNLIAVINGTRDSTRHAVLRYHLSRDGRYVTGADTLLINHPNMQVPTTLDVIDGNIYILANSQLNNLNQKENTIRFPERLNPTYIIKLQPE